MVNLINTYLNKYFVFFDIDAIPYTVKLEIIKIVEIISDNDHNNVFKAFSLMGAPIEFHFRDNNYIEELQLHELDFSSLGKTIENQTMKSSLTDVMSRPLRIGQTVCYLNARVIRIGTIIDFELRHAVVDSTDSEGYHRWIDLQSDGRSACVVLDKILLDKMLMTKLAN